MRSGWLGAKRRDPETRARVFPSPGLKAWGRYRRERFCEVRPILSG